jgi:carbonic anhydrase/acetyltransferase-like protein (isoleucine patch superfamily)
MQKFDFPNDLVWHDPDLSRAAFVAPGAQVVGDVRLGQGASVWYNAVLRGDINTIVIGNATNIQDGCVCHLENDRACVVGDYVTVGHKAVLHGCVIEDGVLIGMGAIVLNGAIVKKGAVIGAGTVVKENMVVPENHLVVGVPGRVVRDLGSQSYEINVKWAEKYMQLAAFHRNNQTR